jgi:hypothetical protein
MSALRFWMISDSSYSVTNVTRRLMADARRRRKVLFPSDGLAAVIFSPYRFSAVRAPALSQPKYTGAGAAAGGLLLSETTVAGDRPADGCSEPPIQKHTSPDCERPMSSEDDSHPVAQNLIGPDVAFSEMLPRSSINARRPMDRTKSIKVAKEGHHTRVKEASGSP